MTGILQTSLYLIAGGTVLSGLHHLISAVSNRESRHINLLCGLMALMAAGMVICRTEARAAETVDQLVTMREWEVTFIVLFFTSFIWFFSELTKYRPLKFLIAITGLWSVLLAANVVLPHGAHFPELPQQLTFYQLPWGERVVDLSELQFNQWHYYAWALLLASLAFAFIASNSEYRAEHPRSRVYLNWTLSIFLVSLLVNLLDNARVINFIHMGDFGYFFLIFLLDHKLVSRQSDVITKTNSLLDYLPMGIGLKSREGKYIFANKTFRDYLPGKAVLPSTDLKIFGERLTKVLRQNELIVLNTKKELESQYTVIRDGKSLTFKIIQFPILDSEGSAESICSVHIDITGDLARELEINHLQQQLWRFDRIASSSAITKSLAHEICQPLSAIMSNAQAGLRFVRQGNPDIRETEAIYEDIVRDGKRAASVVSGLRSMLKNQEEPYEIFDLTECITEVAAFMHTEFVNQSVTVVQHLENDLYVRANKTLLTQVLLNLILNALEAMRETTDRENKIILNAISSDEKVTVTVRDTGPGIPDEKVETVFEGFFTTKPQGLGVGLEVCKTIMESHQGKIWAHAGGGGESGASISFELPRAINHGRQDQKPTI